MSNNVVLIYINILINKFKTSFWVNIYLFILRCVMLLKPPMHASGA